MKNSLVKMKRGDNSKNYVYIILILGIYTIFVSQLNLSLVQKGITMLEGNRGTSQAGLASLPQGASESDVVSAILPKDADLNRPYSWKGKTVTLTAYQPGNGYDMLVDMERSISLDSLTPEQKAKYKDLIMKIYHPCCNAPVGACGCKHAVATRGLIKNLLKEGWSDDQILNEVFLWQRFWWPKHYAIMATYIFSQGVNPAEVPISEWVGKKMSTLRAGRAAAAQIGVK